MVIELTTCHLYRYFKILNSRAQKSHGGKKPIGRQLAGLAARAGRLGGGREPDRSGGERRQGNR